MPNSGIEKKSEEILFQSTADGLGTRTLNAGNGAQDATEGCFDSTLQSLVDAFYDPVYIVTIDGCILYTNQPAKSRDPIPPEWLRSLPSLPSSIAKKHGGCAIPMSWCDRHFLFVITAEGGQGCCDRETHRSILDDLPPSLAKIAELLLQGLSDKEIVEKSHLTLSSVRTYTARIYRRLGIGGRAELLAKQLQMSTSTNQFLQSKNQ